MSPLERALETLGSPSEVLERHRIPVKRRMACCPFHEDRDPSLSIYQGKDGKERWKCFAGCGGGDALDLAAALAGREVRDYIRDLFG